MRLSLFAFMLSVLVAQSAAQAAVVWSETTENGKPVTAYARGADLNEANAATRAHGGQNQRVLLSCRQPGWFAYVGAEGQTARGVSCGYGTEEAALLQAHQQCELEGGRCDFETTGKDEGVSLTGDTSLVGKPANLPGAVGERSAGNGGPTGPVNIQETP